MRRRAPACPEHTCARQHNHVAAAHTKHVCSCRAPRQVGWATGGGSSSKPKREREFNQEQEVFINRVQPKLRARVASVAARTAETIKAQAVKAAARMARVAGLLAGKRKNRRFAHGAAKQPARKEQRKEAQAIQNADQQLQRSLYRQEQIAILSHAVHNGTCSDMLVPLADDLNVGSDVSRAQATRAQIQCMVVLEFFRLLEARAQENEGQLLGGEVYELAAQAGERAALSSSLVWEGWGPWEGQYRFEADTNLSGGPRPALSRGARCAACDFDWLELSQFAGCGR